MINLRILADGKNEKDQANNRGRLFEKVCAEVLRRYGYAIDKNAPSVNYSGMEIDIEGHHEISRAPLYAECKCYSADIKAPQVQAFAGKYLSMYLKNKKAQGVFIALPKVNPHALGFIRDNLETDKVSFRLLQETDVIDALVETKSVVSHATIQARISVTDGTPGDTLLVCTDRGFFWIQYLLPADSSVPTAIQLFDGAGNPVSDSDTYEYLSRLLPDISGFSLVDSIKDVLPASDIQEDPVVEMRGSSTCFEYQFPAAPEFFVGRQKLLESFDTFLQEVIQKSTSCRGILFQANSGWGKSSLVLAACHRASRQGHYALSIDARSAQQPSFLVSVLRHIHHKFGDFRGTLTQPIRVGGADSAVDALSRLGKELESAGKLLIVFFDQFENVFYEKPVLEKVSQAMLRITDAQTNVIFGFAWKSDLVGLTGPFPYRLRDVITDSSRTWYLRQFSEVETEALLDHLAKELRAKLRKDLRFLLAEFSQGYPWLLKKLCAHVKSLRYQGATQAEIARGLLNVEDLFKEDLQGLSGQQLTSLHLIAKCAPVNDRDVPDDIAPAELQSLIDRRLVVKVGTRYDIYWDIFRDYLNTGKLPVDEIYLLRAPIGGVLRAIHILNKNGGVLSIDDFCSAAAVSEHAFFNLAKDLRLLSLATVEESKITLACPVVASDDQLRTQLTQHLKEKLPRNRSLNAVLFRLEQDARLSMDDLASMLREHFPYISASAKTWNTYARIAANWLDFSDLAILDKQADILLSYDPTRQIRERSLSFVKRRKRISVPSIQFEPLICVASRLADSAQAGEPVDWSGLKKSTIYKALAMLEVLGFISRRQSTIILTPECETFARQPNRRVELAAPRAKKMPMFRQFLELVQSYSDRLPKQKEIAVDFMRKANLDWTVGTAETNVKIMLDWARHLRLAPEPFLAAQKGRFRKKKSLPLFENMNLNANKAMDSDEE